MALTKAETAAPTATYTTVQLMTPDGPVFRRVRSGKPRSPTLDVIPIIDLSSMHGDEAARKMLAAQIRAAAENTGFFYVRNHGIPQDLIQQALEQVKVFFNQSPEDKDRVAFDKAGKFCGYHGVGSTQINNKETRGKRTDTGIRHNAHLLQIRKRLSP
jgi:isopenicillin N synthase-like dioxygenase